MIDSSNPIASPKLPTRLSMLELMVPLSFDYFAWLRSTGIEHQPGPENKMPWGINALKLPQAMRDPRNDSGLNIEAIPVQGQRKFRSRTPAPAMIPHADIHEISEALSMFARFMLWNKLMPTCLRSLALVLLMG